MKHFLSLFFVVVLAFPRIVGAQTNVQDSLALVDLYNSTGGPNWTNKGYWLTPTSVDNWFGVKTSRGVNSRVTSVYLINNNLKGTIPNSIGNLTQLNNLNFSSNQLTGAVPSSITNLTKLVQFYLNNNKLSGTILDKLTTAPNLSDIVLNNNQFTGGFPTSIANWSNLQKFIVNNNQFADSLPNSISVWKNNLSYLYLHNNQFYGKLPDSIGFLAGLYFFDISNNKFSGRIPASVSKLKQVFKFAIEKNNFTFDGMSTVSSLNMPSGTPTYSPQGNIPIVASGNLLKVSGGGNRFLNSFDWYKDGTLVATNVGDSTYLATSFGKYNAVVTNFVVTGLTLYSDTILIVPLAIKEISLKGTAKNNSILLDWEVIGENITANFYLERSTDQKNFKSIAQFSSASTGDNRYQFNDRELPNSRKVFYRVAGIERDGNKVYSKVVAVESLKQQASISVYPNPVKDKLVIQGSGIASWVILNEAGKTVAAQSATNSTNPSINVSALAKGMYIIQVITKDGTKEEAKFIK